MQDVSREAGIGKGSVYLHFASKEDLVLSSIDRLIERLVAEKDSLADRASYGSLVVTFRLPVRPKPTVTPAPAKGWDPATDVANATGKLVRIGQRATSAGIWLAIVGLPVITGGAVLLLLGWQSIRLGRWMIARRSAAAGSSS